MKVVKNVNNNVAICRDDDGNELVAFGRGIGFKSPPYEINDMSKIQRTFYNVDQRFFSLLNLIPEKIFLLSAQIVDYARNKVSQELSPNIVFTLADHLQFALEREKQGGEMSYSSFYGIPDLNPTEYDIGLYGVSLCNYQLKANLSKDEALGIAVHFINAEMKQNDVKYINNGPQVIDSVIEIIESFFEMSVDRSGFNYSRFATHMEYLLQRNKTSTMSQSNNAFLYDKLVTDYPETYQCVLQIKKYLEKNVRITLNDEEIVYLIIHVNRLCSREDLHS